MQVILAEDSTLLREGLVRLLVEDGHEILAAVGDGDALVAAVRAAADAGSLPDGVCVDVRMPPTHTDEGLRAALSIRQSWPSVGVLVLSQYVEKSYASELITSGQDRIGYLLKDRVMRVEEFLEALDRVGTGGVALDPEVVRQLLSRTTRTDPLQKLTAREREVLATMAEGHNNTSIAQRLYITPSADEKHANSIFDKLGLTHTPGYNRRIQAVVTYLTT